MSEEKTHDDTKPLEMVSYYEYKNNGVVDLFTEEIKVATTNPQPANTTKWKPVYDSETQDAYWDGKGWIAGHKFESLTDEAIQEAAVKVLSQDLSDAVRQLQKGYPEVEVSTWARQEADARSYVEDKTASPFLQQLAKARNASVADLAETIVAKADAHAVKVAALIGAHKAAVEAVDEIVITPDMLRCTSLVRSS